MSAVNEDRCSIDDSAPAMVHVGMGYVSAETYARGVARLEVERAEERERRDRLHRKAVAKRHKAKRGGRR